MRIIGILILLLISSNIFGQVSLCPTSKGKNYCEIVNKLIDKGSYDPMHKDNHVGKDKSKPLLSGIQKVRDTLISIQDVLNEVGEEIQISNQGFYQICNKFESLGNCQGCIINKDLKEHIKHIAQLKVSNIELFNKGSRSRIVPQAEEETIKKVQSVGEDGKRKRKTKSKEDKHNSHEGEEEEIGIGEDRGETTIVEQPTFNWLSKLLFLISIVLGGLLFFQLKKITNLESELESSSQGNLIGKTAQEAKISQLQKQVNNLELKLTKSQTENSGLRKRNQMLSNSKPSSGYAIEAVQNKKVDDSLVIVNQSSQEPLRRGFLQMPNKKNLSFKNQEIKDSITSFTYFTFNQTSETEATYQVIDNADVFSAIMDSIESVLLPVSDIEGGIKNNATRIKTIEPGNLRLIDDEWTVVVGQKCKIVFE